MATIYVLLTYILANYWTRRNKLDNIMSDLVLYSILLPISDKKDIDKSTIEPTLGFFVADFGNFENGWEDLWEFHDFGWEFLYFGSNHTAQLSRGNVDRI